MEMNTRLQVEHPVTEYITGLDLVAEQIRIAEGKTLPFKQDALSINGHAIECRIYAEDPAANFIPSPGTVTFHQAPVGVGVRVDAGLQTEGNIPIHYDPMISKVITWGSTRDEATQRMIFALEDYCIAGVKTTRGFCRRVMESAAWQEARLSTHFVDKHPELLAEKPVPSAEAAAVAAALLQEQCTESPLTGVSAWQTRRRKGGVLLGNGSETVVCRLSRQGHTQRIHCTYAFLVCNCP